MHKTTQTHMGCAHTYRHSDDVVQLLQHGDDLVLVLWEDLCESVTLLHHLVEVREALQVLLVSVTRLDEGLRGEHLWTGRQTNK